MALSSTKKVKRFRERHPEKYRAWNKLYYSKNSKRIITQKREKRQNNPELRIRNSIRVRTRKVLKGEIKSGSTIELLGCSFDEYINYLTNKFSGNMSLDNYGAWQIDHIIPLSLFNLENSEEQEIAFHFTNTQPLWSEDNKSKRAKMV